MSFVRVVKTMGDRTPSESGSAKCIALFLFNFVVACCTLHEGGVYFVSAF